MIEVVEQHYRNLAQTDRHMLKYTEEEWLRTEANLTRERGLWGPLSEDPLTKWMLDMTEGPSRMRKKLIRNELFYLHYPAPHKRKKDDKEKPLKYKRPTSLDSLRWHDRFAAKGNSSRMLLDEDDETEALVEMEYDDCDVAVPDHKDLTIDEQMRKIGQVNSFTSFVV